MLKNRTISEDQCMRAMEIVAGNPSQWEQVARGDAQVQMQFFNTIFGRQESMRRDCVAMGMLAMVAGFYNEELWKMYNEGGYINEGLYCQRTFWFAQIQTSCFS